MAIHQIQVRYDPVADRMLLQLNTTEGEQYQVWLTRRMLRQLYPPFRQVVVSAGVAQAAPQAVPVPEARRMLEEVALQRPLPGTEFGLPFAHDGVSHPLGTEPLLPQAIEFTPAAEGAASLALHDAQGRRVAMTLTPEVSNALLRLIDGALPAADWGWTAPSAAAAEAEPVQDPSAALPTKRVLN